MRLRGFAFVALVGCFVGILVPTGASAEVSGADVCPGYSEPALMGDSIATAVQFPYFPAASPQRYYEGAVLRPADTVAYPGKRPSVILQPGLGQDKCTLWWAAQYLAGHGFVATVHDTPDPGLGEDPDFPYIVEWAQVAVAGDVAVVDFLKNDLNAQSYSDTENLGFVGYDEGALVGSVIDTSLLGVDQAYLGIDAIVSFNNLRSRLTGDVSGNGAQCFGEPQGWFIPASPALGFAEDEPCDGLPTVFDPAIKLAGWRTWKSYGFPTMEIVPRAVEHEDFADENGGEQVWRDVGHYTTAWFRRWLGNDPLQNQVLLGATLNGRPTVDALSNTFQSAAFLPPDTDTDDLTCDLGGQCLKEVTPEPPDPTDPPDQPDPTDPTGSPKFKVKMKLNARVIKPGGRIKATVIVRNAGDGSGSGRLCQRSKGLFSTDRRCWQLRTVAPGGVRKIRFRLHARKRVKPGRFAEAGYTFRTSGSSQSGGSSVRFIRHKATARS